MTDLEDAVTAEVEQALSQETFDALDFFTGASLPEADVTLYADSAAAFELAELLDKQKEQERIGKSDGYSIGDDVEWIDEDRITELHEQLLNSQVVFHLKAVAPAALEAIRLNLIAKHGYKAGTINEAYNADYNNTVIAKSIGSVRNRSGAKDTSTWDSDRVSKLVDALQPSEFEKLWDGTLRVNFIGNAIDRAVTADFS